MFFTDLFKSLGHLDIFTFALKMTFEASKRWTPAILIFLLKFFKHPLVVLSLKALNLFYTVELSKIGKQLSLILRNVSNASEDLNEKCSF